MGAYPIQTAKVQRPALREETLSRDRLLDWLKVKVHHRVVHVIAEAGYGKTTLLADFGRRTRLRTLWYRLGQDDRSWVAFLNYLVAAGQASQETFGSATSALLREIGPGGPSLDAVLDSFIRDLQPLGEMGALLILDDYHLVDDAPDVRHIMRSLLERAPERVNFVVASRRPPGLPVARLRAQGEVAELHTDDLRFSTGETERLFRETYGRPLEADVLTDLSERTDGWAASLQLVNSAIQARTPAEIRAFVRSLSGAEGDLYDYLAEEVIGTLAPDLQQFLMRVSVLQDLDPLLMETATGLPAADVARLAAEGERCGLLVRGHDAPASHRGIHPLVRQFLLHRLASEIGTDGLREMHLSIANAHFNRWAVACHHFSEAGEPTEVHRCLESSVRSIFGAGNLPLAAEFLARFPPLAWSSPLAMIDSRTEFLANRPVAAIRQAELAVDLERSPLALQNLSSMHMFAGDLSTALQIARDATHITDSGVEELFEAAREMLQASVDGRLPALETRLLAMASRQRSAGLTRYFGVSMLNVAHVRRAQGNAEGCAADALEAERALEESAALEELFSARMARLWAVANLEGVDSALNTVHLEMNTSSADLRAEIAAELAAVHIWYGSAEDAEAALQSVSRDHVRPSIRNLIDLASSELCLRLGDYSSAARLLPGLSRGPSGECAHHAHQAAIRAHLAVVVERADATELVRSALKLSSHQGAWLWWVYTKLLAALAAPAGRASLPAEVRQQPAYLSMLAELVAGRMHLLAEPDKDVVRAEARRRPERWRPAMRSAVGIGDHARWDAAWILDEIGDSTDVAMLRAIARGRNRRHRHGALGRGLARRLASRLVVDDLGRVRLHVGSRSLDSAGVRRKVLALLCFLVTRASFSATRDEVLDALWPDLAPSVAGNSLNQTVYFLRRVIEPDFVEDTSAGYVHFEGNMLWLDSDLVVSRSGECWSLISNTDEPTSEEIARLSRLYSDRFALDFAYEEWALPFRESLHSAYLQLIETTVKSDIDAGQFVRGASLARKALAIDPGADTLEELLVRLYKVSGAHAAAAEQYGHYATRIRDQYAIEPPALDTL